MQNRTRSTKSSPVRWLARAMATLTFGALCTLPLHSEAAAQQQVGPWVIIPSGEAFDSGCYMMSGDRRDYLLMVYQERPEDGVGLGVGSSSFELSTGWRNGMTLSLGGEPLTWGATRAADGQTLVTTEFPPSADILTRLMEGSLLEFEFEEHKARFNPWGLEAALPAFNKCVEEHPGMPSLFAPDLSINPSVGLGEPGDDWNRWPDADATVEEELEEPEEGFDADAVAALLNSEPALAELQCFVDSSSIFGILGTATQSPPIELIVAIEEDGGVRTNGTRIEPLHVQLSEDGVTPAHSVFRAQDVFSAAMRTEIGDAFAQALTSDPSDKNAMGLGALLGSPASMIPEDRLVSFSLVNDDVTILGNLLNGQLGHVASAPCLRFR